MGVQGLKERERKEAEALDEASRRAAQSTSVDPKEELINQARGTC